MRPHAIRERDGDNPLVTERLQRWCRASENQASAFELRPHRRRIAGVVARRRPLLVAGLVLLVHHDRAQPLHRREHGGPGADRHEPLASAQGAPRVGALAIGQPRVEHRHTISKDAAHPRDGLRRQGNFRHQQNCPVSRLHDGTKHVEVYERLARACNAV